MIQFNEQFVLIKVPPTTEESLMLPFKNTPSTPYVAGVTLLKLFRGVINLKGSNLYKNKAH